MQVMSRISVTQIVTIITISQSNLALRLSVCVYKFIDHPQGATVNIAEEEEEAEEAMVAEEVRDQIKVLKYLE